MRIQVTAHRETFSGSTDPNGIFSYTWRIGGTQNGYIYGPRDASGNEGKSGSGEKSFQVIAKGVQDIQSISPSECSNEPGSAGLKFPQNKRTECEKEEYDECQENRKVNGREWGGGRCDNMYELFWDDDCFGFENSRECNEWFNNGKKNSVKIILITKNVVNRLRHTVTKIPPWAIVQRFQVTMIPVTRDL